MMRMNLNIDALKNLKKGLYSEMNKTYKLLEEHPLYKFYVVAGVGTFLFITDRLVEGQINLVNDQLVAQNRAMVNQEMRFMNLGDAAAAAAAARVKPRSENILCVAFRKLVGG